LFFEGRKIAGLIPLIFELEFIDFLIIWLKVSIGAFLAFFLETSEFLVLRLTSSLTLSIAGIFKELIQLTLAVIINNEILSVYNDIGLVLCLGGIILHVVHKYCLTAVNIDKQKFDDIDNLNIQLKSQNSPSNGKLKYKNEKSKRGGGEKMTSWSNHKTRLLDSSDDETSDSEAENRSSEILFDILKRRE
jgi:solute carrier family 35, member C2